MGTTRRCVNGAYRILLAIIYLLLIKIYSPFLLLLVSSILINGDSILITAGILVLNESVNFTRDNSELQSSSNLGSGWVVLLVMC